MTELSQPGSNNIDSVRSNDADVALSVRGLSTSFRTGQGLVTAVSHVSFDLMRGEALGIVGESGCGKSVTARSIMRLLPDHVTRYGSDSRIEFNGDNLLDYT
jgi:ABC-type dipeptide/oligopeptide/nickel transport system ATPase component